MTRFSEAIAATTNNKTVYRVNESRVHLSLCLVSPDYRFSPHLVEKENGG